MKKLIATTILALSMTLSMISPAFNVTAHAEESSHANDPVYASMTQPSESMSDYQIKARREYGKICGDTKDPRTVGVLSMGAFYTTSGQKLPDKFKIYIGRITNFAYSKSQDKWIILDDQPCPCGIYIYTLPWETAKKISCKVTHNENNVAVVELTAKEMESACLHFWGKTAPHDNDDYLFYACAYDFWCDEPAVGKLSAAIGIDAKDNTGGGTVSQLFSSRGLATSTKKKTHWGHTVPVEDYDKYHTSDLNDLFKGTVYTDPSSSSTKTTEETTNSSKSETANNSGNVASNSSNSGSAKSSGSGSSSSSGSGASNNSNSGSSKSSNSSSAKSSSSSSSKSSSSSSSKSSNSGSSKSSNSGSSNSQGNGSTNNNNNYNPYNPYNPYNGYNFWSPYQNMPYPVTWYNPANQEDTKSSSKNNSDTDKTKNSDSKAEENASNKEESTEQPVTETAPANAPEEETTSKEVKSTKLAGLTVKKNTIKVKWKKKGKKVDGYQVEYATNKKFTKNANKITIKGSKKTSTTIKKLDYGTKYFVRVRTYKIIDGKKVYSNWSKRKSVSIPYQKNRYGFKK